MVKTSSDLLQEMRLWAHGESCRLSALYPLKSLKEINKIVDKKLENKFKDECFEIIVREMQEIKDELTKKSIIRFTN